MPRRILAADLFCGAGGASTGFVRACRALGLDYDLLAVNHWPTAVETHSANHPNVRHLCESIERVDPREVVPGGRLHLLLAGPECFPAGTLILTTSGLTPIEDVRVGEEVLTHLNRWRRVASTMKSRRDTVFVRGVGHYGIETTAAHPFYVRHRTQHWPAHQRSGEWRWADPVWASATDLRPGTTFWATPTDVPALSVFAPAYTEQFWWMVGRWVGDGSVDDRPGKGGAVAIACGNHEADALAPRLAAAWPNGEWKRRQTRTATLFETRSWTLVSWLVESFGKLAHGKTIPAWAFGMNVQWRAALLAGYCSADGHREALKQDTCTVSKRLAVGIRLLVESLGHRAAIYRAPQHATEIEGRTVNVRDLYRVKWTVVPGRTGDNFADGSHAWSRVREVRPGRADVEVFNLSVEEDESYVADGVVVHNCTHFSTARGGRPVNPQSRASAWHILKWAQELYIDTILIENVPEFRSWGPIGANHQPLKSKKGQTYRAFLEALRSLGYVVEDRILNAADYGDPTTRQRLFILARRGRRSLGWPMPTHSKSGGATLFGPTKRWAPARSVIDWGLKGQSIFRRKKSLRPATLARILAGLQRFGGPELRPFLMHITHGGRLHDVDRPLPTVTTAKRGEIALVEPYVLQQQSGGVARSVGQPLPTIAAKGAVALVQPFLVAYHTERDGETPRTHSVDEPIPTLTAGGNRFGVVEPFIFANRTNNAPKSLDQPVPALCTGDHIALVEPFLTKYNRTAEGAYSVDDPLDTVTARDRFGLVQPVIDGLALDIHFRMLQPHELAAAMSFPKTYTFAGTREDTVRQIGNSWPGELATALCRSVLEAYAECRVIRTEATA